MTRKDVISREAVIKDFTQWRNKMAYSIGEGYSGVSILDTAIRAIKALPSVTPSRPQGHWILLDECANSGYYCSNCQKKLVKEGWSNTVKNIKYCPNCGARMEGSEESSDADSD